jgi:hypothetical protein
MRASSRVLALVGFTSLIVAPLPVAASEPPVEVAEPPVEPAEAPIEPEEPPLDTDTEEPPLDTDTEEPPLDTDTDTEPPAPDLDTDASAEVDDGYTPLRHSPEARTARRWLAAGIAATSVGGVLVGGAIAMGMSDPCQFGAGNSCFTDSRNRAALTMGIPGGVLLLGGIAMTVVGALQKRKLFYNYATFTAGRDHIGVVVVGRF